MCPSRTGRKQEGKLAGDMDEFYTKLVTEVCDPYRSAVLEYCRAPVKGCCTEGC